jgi:phage/plasmid-like protein (TIGR03299 family)
MAHEVETMMYVGATPWHKLGVKVVGAPTCEEAIKHAGLDWEVGSEPLYLDRGNGECDPTHKIEARAHVRTMNGKTTVLGVVGPKTEILQNAQAFAWFDPFVRSGEATLETAGSLREGRIVWILARIAGNPLVVVPRAHDTVERYILLSNAHDGSRAVSVGFSPIRVVCANTLAMAESDGASALLKVRHTRGMHGTLDAVREVMNTARARFEATAEQYRFLASRDIDAAGLDQYVRKVFDQAPAPAETEVVPWSRYGMRAKKETRTDTYNRERREAVERLFLRGKGNDAQGVRGTRWAAYNAITEYLGNDRPRGGTLESRTESLAMGGKSGAQGISARALKLALVD